MIRSTVARNTAWILLDNVVSLALSFGVTMLVARYLGPEKFGLFSYTFATASIFAIVGHLGLDGLVVREFKLRPDENETILGTVFNLKLVAYAAAAAAMMFYAFWAHAGNSTAITLFGFAALSTVFSSTGALNAWFQARSENRYPSMASIISKVVMAVLKIAAIAMASGVAMFAAANAAGAALAFALTYFFFRWTGGMSIFKWRSSVSEARRLMGEGFLLFLAAAFTTVYLKIGQIMLQWMSTPEALGNYAVAALLSESIYILPIAITTAVFPRMIQSFHRSTEEFEYELQLLFDFLVILGLCAILGVVLLSDPVITLAFGEKYGSVYKLLSILSLAIPFMFLRAALNRWIVITRLSLVNVIMQGAGALLNVGLGFALIPHFHAEGAAAATVVSYAFATYASLAISPQTRPLFRTMSRSLLMPWGAALRLWQFGKSYRTRPGAV